MRSRDNDRILDDYNLAVYRSLCAIEKSREFMRVLTVAKRLRARGRWDEANQVLIDFRTNQKAIFDTEQKYFGERV